MQEAVEVGLPLGSHQGWLELVQPLEQAAHQRLGGHLHGAGLFLQHPLAVVVELGREALEMVAILLHLLLGVVAWRRRLALPLRVARRRGLARRRGVAFRSVGANAALVGHPHAGARLFLFVSLGSAHPEEAPPSSTISPSTTSPSPGEPDPSPPGEPPAAASAPD